MPTRIEIELTSAGSDGSWTWRAAGAREPRGTLDGSILPDGASVGDQLKVEAEKDIDGIRVLSIVLPKQKDERGGVLELLPSGDFEPVIQQRATRDRHEGGDRGRPRRDRREQGDRGDREREPWVDKPYRPERPPGDDRTGAGERRGGPRRGEGGEGRRHQRPHFTPPPELPQRPKPKRLRPGKLRRAEVLAEIPEEQRPVAELALQGMAAVRQRLREDNARLKAEDKPEMPEATVLKMAENLLPQMRVADWLDRAEAAKRQLANLDLRDLRSVVAASDDPLVVRDEATRDLAVELKAALVTKQEEELNLWLGDVEAAVDVGRVVRALRLSAMPPKAGVPFPHELGTKLGEATTAALTADDPADRWIAVLEAAAFSPIRSQVTPSAAPAQPAAELVATVTRLAPLLPQVAALLGIEVPAKGPIPKPLRPAPRKKEAAKPAAAEPRGDIATHPGPKGDAKPKAEPKPVAEAAEASVAAVVEAPEPEVVEPDVASEPEAAEAEVADAADASVAAVVEAPDAEVVEPEVASEPEVAEAEAEAEAEVADAVDVPEPEVVEAPEVEVVEPEVASEPEAAQAVVPDVVDVPAADVAEAPEAEVIEPDVASEPVVAEAEAADAVDVPEPEVADAPEVEVVEPEVASEVEVADAVDAAEPVVAEAEVADVVDVPEPEVVEAPEVEVVEPEVASEPVVAEAEVADVTDVPEPEDAEAPEAEVVEPEVASEPDVAEAPESAAVDVPAADVVDALEAEVAESEVTSEPDAP